MITRGHSDLQKGKAGAGRGGCCGTSHPLWITWLHFEPQLERGPREHLREISEQKQLESSLDCLLCIWPLSLSRYPALLQQNKKHTSVLPPQGKALTLFSTCWPSLSSPSLPPHLASFQGRAGPAMPVFFHFAWKYLCHRISRNINLCFLT